jgi:plastocyanin
VLYDSGLRRYLAIVGIALATAMCSNSGGSTTPSPPVVGTTITITSSGVSPKNLQISPGTQVTFINNDSRNHEMDSDPHPEHTDCPAINQVGPIVPGQSKQTGNLNTVRSCGYHDHGNPENTGLQGRITIQ